MANTQEIHPVHSHVPAVLRIVGPLVVAAGVMLIVIGMASLFATMGSSGPPRYFWCAFVGVPVLCLGIVLTAPAFTASVSRYMSAERASFRKEAFTGQTEGTIAGERTRGQAFAEPTAPGASNAEVLHYVACPGCQAPNPSTASNCKECGAPLGIKVCRRCQVRNDSQDHFCFECGAPLA